MSEWLLYMRELHMPSILFRLLLAMLSGGLLGLERGRKRRPAGCRTYMLVCLGATLTMLLSQYNYVMFNSEWSSIAGEIGLKNDISRFGAQVINGIGFLATGTILVTRRQQVKGLTTAAGLWAAACVGIAVGAGFYECVFLCVPLIFLAMRLFPRIENALVERTRFLNIYVEFQSLDDFGAIINKIKTQNARIYDVAIGQQKGHNPNAVFSVRLQDQQPHNQLLTAIAELKNVYAIEEF